MADLKISQFADGGTVQPTDEIATNRAGTNTKVRVGEAASLDASGAVGDVIVWGDDGGGNPSYPPGDASQLTGILNDTLLALSEYNSGGFIAQTSLSNFTGRNITGTSERITVFNSTGVSGNPIIDIASTYVGQSSITTVGTITAGVWNGTDIAVADGGTGRSSQTAYAVLCGGTSTTSAQQSVASVGTAGQVLTSNGAGALPSFQNPSSSSIVDNWVAYTPTFTGFGTVSSVFFWSRRVGQNLEIMGKFTSGTPSATEARITIGYNGVNSNVTSSSTLLPTTTAVSGNGAVTIFSATFFGSVTTLVDRSQQYIGIGAQNTSRSSITKAQGSSIATSGDSISLNASIPIQGW